MARMPRLIVPSYPHHVTRRGTRRIRTFFSVEVYQAWLGLVRDVQATLEVDIWAYSPSPQSCSSCLSLQSLWLEGMINRHTIKDSTMSQTKVAITIEEGVLAKVDDLVRRNVFSNRSRAIQEAVQEKLMRLERNRLAEECAKLDPDFEKAMAGEGLSEELAAWPKY